MDPAMEATLSVAIEPDTNFTPYESRVAEPLDSPLATDSEPLVCVPVESDWAPIMEFTSADIFQHSSFGDVLNSLRSLSLSGEPWPNYVRLEWDADDEEIRCPPTTHLVATVDNLTDMLDFDSDGTNDTDVGAGDDSEPPPTGRWTATSSYDIYMVDTPKEDNATKRTQQRINPPDKSQNDSTDADLNPVTVKIVITVLER